MATANEDALNRACSALELIATPMRPDGTYNRDRAACQQLARKTLDDIQQLYTQAAATVAPAPLLTGRLTVYSDGGCKGNPGPAGWGVVVVAGGKQVLEAAGYIGSKTNQVAELEAAIQGLMLTAPGAEVELVSDSQYVLKGLSEWRAGWERRGFTNSVGDPVANQDYWTRLYAVADARKVKVRWVRGHSGDQFNERCDKLASAAIETRQLGATARKVVS